MSADIAILMPVHNAPDELRETLESLKSQEAPFICYLIDDGSVPPVRIDDDYGYPIEIIRLEANRGITAALNVGLDAIIKRGFRYIARLDAGDFALPGRFEAQKTFLQANPDHALVSTACEFFDDNGQSMFDIVPPLRHEEIRRSLFYRNTLLHSGIMFNVAFLSGGTRYDERFRAGQDYEIVRRLSKTAKVANLPEKLTRYRFSANSITTKRNFRYFGRIRIQLMYFEPFNLHSYLGVLRSLALCLVPFGLIHRIRTIFSRLA